MFYFYTFLYSLKSCFKPEFPSSAKHKSNFEEGSKPNNYWSTVFPTVKVNVEQLFGYPHSSKYFLTDVNVCRVVQYIDMAGVTRTAADRIFLQKQIVETFIVHYIVYIAQTRPQRYFSVGPQRARSSSLPCTPLCMAVVSSEMCSSVSCLRAGRSVMLTC